MTQKYNRMAVLAKVEATYGTDIVPTGAANAILLTDVTITPMNGTEIKRNLITDALGNKGSTLATIHTLIQFKVEMAGSGAAGTVPGWGVLMRGCAMSETINAGVSAVYAPVSAGEESLSIYMNLDGVLHKLLGARGSVSLEINAGQIPYLNFSFIGLFADPAEVVMPALDLTGWKEPLTVSNANTPTLTLHGYSAVTQTLTLNIQNQNTYRDLINSAAVKFADRDGVGQISIEAPILSTKDFFGIAKNATTGALQIIHGGTAGKIIQIDAPKVQFLNPSYSDSDGITMLDMNMGLLPNVADDEIVITVQ